MSIFLDSTKPLPRKIKKRKKEKDDVEKPKKLKKDEAPSSIYFNTSFCRLSKTNISASQLVLGCVKDVKDTGIGVSLPNGLEGFISIVNISDQFNVLVKQEKMEIILNLLESIKIGQIIPCKCVKTQDKHPHIILTALPSEIYGTCRNTDIDKGIVFNSVLKSKEDYFYIMDVGINNISAVVKKEDVLNFSKRYNQKITIGSTIPCILDQRDGRTLKCNINKNMILQTRIKPSVSFDSIIPGCRCNVTIEQTTKKGLIVKFGNFCGFILTGNLHNSVDDYTIGKSIGAIVLYPLSMSKEISFSNKPHLLNLDYADFVYSNYKYGNVLSNVKINAVTDNGILCLKKRITDDKQILDRIFIHNHQIDNESSGLKLKSKKIICRIINFNLLQNEIIASMKKSVIERKFMNYNDVTVGIVVNVQIEKILPKNSIKVKLSPGIYGIVPYFLVCDRPSDLTMQQCVTNFLDDVDVTKTLQAKVLSIDYDEKRILLSFKKSFINGKLANITEISEDILNVITVGYVKLIKPNGLVVEFLNELRGWLPSNELKQCSNLKSRYTCGDTIHAKIKFVDVTSGIIKLGLNFKEIKCSIGSEEIEKSVHVGEIYKCQVIKKNQTGLFLSLHVNDLKSLIGFCPIYLLSDNSDNALYFYNLIGVDDVVDFVVLRIYPNLIVTCRNSFMSKIGTFYPGFVSKISQRMINVTTWAGKIINVVNKDCELNENLIPIDYLKAKQAVLCQVNSKIDKFSRFTRFLKGKIPNNATVELNEPININSLFSLSHSHLLTNKCDSAIEYIRLSSLVSTFTSLFSKFKRIIQKYPIGTEMAVTFKRHDKMLNESIFTNQDGKFYVKGEPREKSCKFHHVVWCDFDKHKIYLAPFEKTQNILEPIVNGVYPAKIIFIHNDVYVAQINDSFLSYSSVKSHINDCISNVELNDTINIKLHTKTPFENVFIHVKSLENETVCSFIENLNVECVDEIENVNDDKVKFDWDDSEFKLFNESNSDSESSAVIESKPSKGSTLFIEKHEKLTDKEIYLQESKLVDPHFEPATVEDFEKFVLAEPNNSINWIKYVAYYAGMDDINMARSVCEKGIQTINYKHEDDKLDLWTTYLNLENGFGDETSFQKLFQRAIKYNDEYCILERVVQIFSDSKKMKEMEIVFKRMMKNFRHNKKSWITIGSIYMQNNMLEKARNTMQKSLKNMTVSE
ncbi:hypothetical protein A3Q56_06334, partial [Intoshia linei]